MAIFKLLYSISSVTSDYVDIAVDELDAAGVYGAFVIEAKEKIYGQWSDATSGSIICSDDLMYWFISVLKVAVKMNSNTYCAIKDIEHPPRWIEFKVVGNDVKIDTVDALSSDIVIDEENKLHKVATYSSNVVSKLQFQLEVLSKTISFLEAIINIEPRLGCSNDYNRALQLLAELKYFV